MNSQKRFALAPYMTFVFFTILLIGCTRSVVVTKSLDDFFKPTDWVAKHSNDPDFVIVDTRQEADYRSGHIPGAINIPRTIFMLTRDIIDPHNGKIKKYPNSQPMKYVYDSPSPTEWIDILTHYGISMHSVVVAYDYDTAPFAGRFIWTMKLYGHSAAYVMLGGIDKWKDIDGRYIDNTPRNAIPGIKPYLITSYNNYRVTKSDILSAIDQNNKSADMLNIVFSDVRTPSEYTGFITKILSGAPSTGKWNVSNDIFARYSNQGSRPGHIPHAIFSDYESSVYKEFLDARTGKPVASTLQKNRNIRILKSEEELRIYFTNLGITPDKTVYNYCEAGNRAGVYTLILLGLGYPRVFNYDGAWNEWSLQGPYYPVETGDARNIHCQ